MSIQAAAKHLYDVGFSTVNGFWSGWLGGSAILAGGKVWTLITNPQLKVSQLLGHVGTPAFRRELAVGIAVYFLTKKIFEILAEKMEIDPNSLKGKAYQLLTTAIAVAAGSLAASAITHLTYHYVMYGIIALTVAMIAKEVIQRWPKQQQAERQAYA